MLRHSCVFAFVLVCTLPAASALADRLDEVEKELAAAYAKLESYTANQKMWMEFDLGQGNSSKSDYSGSYEWMRAGKKVLFRSEMAGTSDSHGMKSKDKTVKVCDGQHVYTLSEQDDDVMAVKEKLNSQTIRAPMLELEMFRNDHTLKLLDDETVDGHACYVIELIAKNTGGPLVKQVHYFSKATGLKIKAVGYDKGGTLNYTQEVTDIKVDVPIAPERFKFRAPEGVPVTDMSKW